MNDWSTFEADARLRSRHRGPRCSVGVLLDCLPPDAREAVERTLENRGVPIPAVLAALEDRVVNAPSPWSLANHRRGKCTCQR